jgi:predicted nucleic acid-binding protein
MSKSKERALTYGLLAHIREEGKLISGPLDMFAPLVKRVLARMSHRGRFSGKSLLEIKEYSEEIYGIDFPIPVLEQLLRKIAEEINTNENGEFILNKDKSFQIDNYVFIEFEDVVQAKKVDIENIEKLFKGFCETCDPAPAEDVSLFQFIESSKFSLAKYLSSYEKQDKDYTVEAQFVDFFRKIPGVYNQIRDLFLGVIIASYLHYQPEEVKTEVELLLDTNFLLGLLDLNTPESTNTCRKILDVALPQGYKITVLSDTLLETTNLLKAKAKHINTSFLLRSIYSEDIYNACERRALNKADLERIADKLEEEMEKFHISIIYDTRKYVNLAKFSHEYERLKNFRSSEFSALHDATALQYVRAKRKKKIKDFELVNCWFVNNSINRGEYEGAWDGKTEWFQPEEIRADDLLNILWLSSPKINNSIDSLEFSEIGLSSMVSLALSHSLPKAYIIRELEDNIQRYLDDESITDLDILRLSTRITNKQIQNISELNEFARHDKIRFVNRIKEESKKQEEIEKNRITRLEEIISEMEEKSESLIRLKAEFEKRVRDDDSIKESELENLRSELNHERMERLKIDNQRRSELRSIFVVNELKKWRRKTLVELVIWMLLWLIIVISFLGISDWNLNKAMETFVKLNTNVVISSIVALAGMFFSSITIKTLYDKYRNFSNIEAYKKSIVIPDDYKELNV